MMRVSRKSELSLAAAFALALFLLLAAPAPAAFTDPVHFGGSSDDGHSVFFESTEQLAPADDDDTDDIYEWRVRRGTRLVSEDVHFDDSAGDGFIRAAQSGSTALFGTYATLLPPPDPPGNAAIDIYRWANGSLTKINRAPGVPPCPSCFATDAWFMAASPDLSDVTFYTLDQLSVGDTDNEFDIYRREGASLTLLTVGPTGGNGPYRLNPEGATPSGEVVFFSTSESLVASDTVPDSFDLYRAGPGGVELIGTGFWDFRGSSADGEKVIFSTPDAVVSADRDAQLDIYEWTSTGGATLLTAGVGTRGDGPFPAIFRAQSPDARRVVFYTDERLERGDTDGLRDIYMSIGGVPMRFSGGTRGGNGNFEPRLGGISADGAWVFFMTEERLVRGDRNRFSDLYARGRGRIIRISRHGGRFSAATANGSRVLFISGRPQVRADHDDNYDLYSWTRRGIRLLSLGPAGGNGNGRFDYVVFSGATPDALHAYFETGESLVRGDRDRQEDLYANTRGRVRLLSRPAG